MTTLFVTNINFEATEVDVAELFEPYSPRLVTIPKNRDTKISRGFAFVEFRGEEDAMEALSKLDGYFFLGRPLKIEIARPRPQEPWR